jgi:hypothetical protein
MKRNLLLIAGLTFLGVKAEATLLLYDAFDYPAGQLLAPTSGAAGQFNAVANTNWYYTGAATANTDPPGIGSGSLSYADVPSPGYGGLTAPTGNSVLFNYTQAGAARIQVVPSVASSGTFFYSGLLKVTGLTGLNTNNGLFFASFNSAVGSATSLPTTGTAVTRLRTDPNDPSKFNVGVGKTTGTTTGIIQWYPTGFDLGTTIFLVAQYEFISGTANDVARMWVNPDVSTFGTGTPPAADLTSAPSGIGDINLFSILLRNINTVGTPAFQFDELRVGTTWADVTPIPEPTAVGLFGLGLLTLFARSRNRALVTAGLAAKPSRVCAGLCCMNAALFSRRTSPDIS